MFGAVLTNGGESDDLYSLIFFDTGGYLDGCGHGTICSTAVWSKLHGLPETPYQVRNPDGSVTVVERLEKRGENGCRATLLMPPASVVERDISIKLDGIGASDGALAHCGNLYLLLEAESVGLSPLTSVPASDMRRIAFEVARNSGTRDLTRVNDRQLEVMFYERLPAQFPTYSTAVVFSNQQLDRSPCGTGSCALLAALSQCAAIETGEAVQTIGPTGGRFELIQRSPANTNGEIRVQLTGDAFITGVHEWLLDDGDPMAEGFRVD